MGTFVIRVHTYVFHVFYGLFHLNGSCSPSASNWTRSSTMPVLPVHAGGQSPVFFTMHSHQVLSNCVHLLGKSLFGASPPGCNEMADHFRISRRVHPVILSGTSRALAQQLEGVDKPDVGAIVCAAAVVRFVCSFPLSLPVSISHVLLACSWLFIFFSQ